MLELTPTQFDQITHHAMQTYPQECCGLLLGYQRQSGASLVSIVRPMVNAWTDDVMEQLIELDQDSSGLSRSTRDRYWIDPKDLLDAQRFARDQGLDVIGVYHSHPDHPAIPSECDRRLAWSGYSYLIVSVCQGVAHDLLCWKLDENSQFQSEELMPLTSVDS